MKKSVWAYPCMLETQGSSQTPPLICRPSSPSIVTKDALLLADMLHLRGLLKVASRRTERQAEEVGGSLQVARYMHGTSTSVHLPPRCVPKNPSRKLGCLTGILGWRSWPCSDRPCCWPPLNGSCLGFAFGVAFSTDNAWFRLSRCRGLAWAIDI